MRRRIAMISEQASPLADPGGVDSGGQNVYVAHLSENLARLGYEVDVFTRRDRAALPEIYEWMDGLRVIHVPAGPPEFVRKEDLPGHMGAFSAYLLEFFDKQERPYGLMHAISWMPGLVAADLKQATGIPFIVTFHALDQFPGDGFEIERRVVQEADGIAAECPQDISDLIERYGASPARIQEIPARLIEPYPDADRLKAPVEPVQGRVNKLFTWSRVARMMSGFYEQVIEQHERAVPEADLTTSEYAEAEIQEQLQIVQQSFESARETLQLSREVLDRGILRAFNLVIGCLARGSKLMVCGNGGNAAHAQHFAADLVGRLVSSERRGLPVMALTADTAFLTAWSNEVGYEKVFSRQIEALARPGDLLVGISTSGRSRNLVEAFTVAREMGMESLALLGGDGGDIAYLSDAALVVPSWNTQRIQETHILILHLLCELVERHISNTTWAYRNNPVWSVSTDRRQK